MLYCRPCFTRGHGFGNRLFPWARARLFAASTGAHFIDPIWTRPALGPLLRGGIALRHYRAQILLHGLFRRRPGDLGAIRGRWVARRASRFAEPPALDAPWSPPHATEGDALVDFRGYEGYFAPLLGRQAFLRRELRTITRPALRRLADRYATVPIAINVRCGRDFPRPGAGASTIRPGDATPIAWFVRALRLLREVSGLQADAYVVSDGTRPQLRDLLTEPGVHLLRPGCAISDLLVLARSRVLLASGSSSFSAWGAFLGGMPVASHPGQPMTAWALSEAGADPVRAELDLRRPDERFLRAAAECLKRPDAARASPLG